MHRDRLLRYCLALALCLWLVPSRALGASLQYVLPGSPITFADSAQTPTRAWTLTALAAGAGRLSAQYDRGAGAGPAIWELRCKLSLTGTNTVGQTVEFYLSTSDGTDADGALGTADAALASDKRRNLLFVGVLVVDQTTTNVTMTVSFRNIYVPQRYFSLGIWNNTALPLETSTAKHRCQMTPVPIQMQ
jgi:hypothetical protein